MRLVDDVTADWEFLLWDVQGVPPPPRVTLSQRRDAAVKTARGLWILRRRGWGPASRYLERLQPAPGTAPHRALQPGQARRLAQREVAVGQLVLRLLHPDALCLPRSFALATCLSALGLPAEVVIARQRVTISARFGFHAWTELHGTVLNDVPSVQSGHTVLQRVACRALAREGAHGSET